MEVYLSDIHNALTLINESKPLKLDVTPMPTQVIVFAATSHKGKGKKASGGTKYISNFEYKAMSPEAQTKAINACKKAAEEDDDEKSSAGAKSAKMMKSISKIMKSPEKDNRRLKKSVSALQKCEEDDDDDLYISFLRVQATFKWSSNFLRNHILKLHLL
jgi:hypothetical protein